MNIAAPKTIALSEILPPHEVLLMGSGPVPIPKAVAEANGKVISHLGETMNKVVGRIQLMGQYLFQTKSSKIFGISGPSSAAMEMATASVVYPGQKVLVLNLGTFSARFAELARGLGADVTEIFPNGVDCFHVQDVELAIKNKSFNVITLVQGETSCGIKNTEVEAICKLAKQHNIITIVDAVCTLSTMPFLMDEWQVDIAVTGGQKGLSSIAGVSLIAFSEAIFEKVLARKELMPHWCLDPRRAYRFWMLHEYHYTAPVCGILALHEALRIICDETLEKRFARHDQSSKSLQLALQTMGMELYAPESCRLNSVVAIKNKNNINTKELINIMIKKYGVEISGAFGLDIIRVGQMGEQCRVHNVQRVVEAIGMAYSELGVKLDYQNALAKLKNE